MLAMAPKLNREELKSFSHLQYEMHQTNKIALLYLYTKQNIGINIICYCKPNTCS